MQCEFGRFYVCIIFTAFPFFWAICAGFRRVFSISKKHYGGQNNRKGYHRIFVKQTLQPSFQGREPPRALKQAPPPSTGIAGALRPTTVLSLSFRGETTGMTTEPLVAHTLHEGTPRPSPPEQPSGAPVFFVSAFSDLILLA